MKTVDDIKADIIYFEHVLRELQKIDSKLYEGKTIPAWRSTRKLMAELERNISFLTNSGKENGNVSQMIKEEV